MPILRNLLMASTYLTRLDTGLDIIQYKIDTFDTAEQVWVSETKGDDGLGDGSKANPYLTLDYAVTQTSTGNALILDGYDFTSTRQNDWAHQAVMFGHAYNGLHVIARKQGTRVTAVGASGTQSTVFIGTETKAYFYGLHLRSDNGGLSPNYGRPLFSNGGSAGNPNVVAECHGVLFEELNANSAMCLCYDNGNTSTVWLYNCTFKADNFEDSYTSAAAQFHVEDSACTSTFYNEGTTINTVSNVTLDGDYRIPVTPVASSITRTYGANRNTNTVSVTFSNTDFGANPPIGNRKDIYYLFMSRGGNSVSSIQIDGQDAELVAEATTTTTSTYVTAQVWRLKDVTKPSGDVYFSLTAQNSTSWHEVYSVVNMELHDVLEVFGQTPDLTGTVNIADGGSLSVVHCLSGSGDASTTWTGVTEVGEATAENNVRGAAFSSDMVEETGRTITAATTYGSGGGAMAGMSLAATPIEDIPEFYVGVGVHSGFYGWSGWSGFVDASEQSLVTSGDFATGNRHSSIFTANITLTSGGGDPYGMFNGAHSSSYYPPNASHLGQFIQIDHGEGERVAISKFKFITPYGVDSGNWGDLVIKISDDGINWVTITDIISNALGNHEYSFNDGSFDVSGIGVANNWASRFFKIEWVTADVWSGGYLQEVEFEGRRYS